MSKRADDLLVNDILISIQRISNYTSSMSFTQFVDDVKTQDAVIRNFTIIGEASSNFSESFIEKNKNLPFREMKDFRNKVVHNYSELNDDTIWDIIQLDLPHLKEELSKAKF